MNLLIRFLLTALVAYVLSLLLQPHVEIQDYGSALVFVLILGLINTLLKPVLLILTLPITVLTLGLFLIILNVLMVMFAGYLTSGIYIQNLWWALIFSVLLSFFSTAVSGGKNK